MTRISRIIVALVICGLGACRQDDSKDIPIESKPPAAPSEAAQSTPQPKPKPQPAAPAEIDITRDAPQTPPWLCLLYTSDAADE